jgi:hypothetical protein
LWQIDPQNKPAVLQCKLARREEKRREKKEYTLMIFLDIATSTKNTNNNTVELIYDDYYFNPAAGLNPYLTPRKAGLRNGVSYC